MTTHHEDMGHDDLLTRLTEAADDVRVAPGDVDAVRARGHQRDLRRRTLGGAAAVVAVLAVVGVGANLLDEPRPPAIISGTESDAPVDPRPSADDADVEVGTISPAEFGFDHSRFGALGVERHHAGAVEVLTTEPVEVAIGLEDGTVVVQQAVPDTGGEFGRLALLVPSEAPRVLVEAGRVLRLLEARDGLAWFTTRTDPADNGGETEERLQSVDLATGEVIDRGAAAGHESGTDALAIADDGTTVFLRCHLTCTTWLGDDLAAVVGIESAQDGYSAGNIVGSAITSDGDHIAAVRINLPVGLDPAAPPPGHVAGDDGLVQLVVTEVATRTEIRVQLPVDVMPRFIEFTPDDRHVVVSGADGAILVEDVFGNPQVSLFADAGGVTVHGPVTGDAAPVGDVAWAGPADEYDDAVWPLPGGEAHDWTVTDGARDASDWRTDPVEVVTRFLDAVLPEVGPGDERPEVAVEQIVEEPDGAAGFVSVSATAGMAEHMVTVRRVANSPYWWVVGADVFDGEVADLSTNGHLWDTYAAQGRDRQVAGHVPPGTTVEIVPTGASPKGALQVSGDVWRWTADADRGQSVGIAMVARDADGRIVHLSVLAFGARDAVATG